MFKNNIKVSHQQHQCVPDTWFPCVIKFFSGRFHSLLKHFKILWSTYHSIYRRKTTTVYRKFIFNPNHIRSKTGSKTYHWTEAKKNHKVSKVNQQQREEKKKNKNKIKSSKDGRKPNLFLRYTNTYPCSTPYTRIYMHIVKCFRYEKSKTWIFTYVVIGYGAMSSYICNISRSCTYVLRSICAISTVLLYI